MTKYHDPAWGSSYKNPQSTRQLVLQLIICNRLFIHESVKPLIDEGSVRGQVAVSNTLYKI